MIEPEGTPVDDRVEAPGYQPVEGGAGALRTALFDKGICSTNDGIHDSSCRESRFD